MRRTHGERDDHVITRMLVDQGRVMTTTPIPQVLAALSLPLTLLVTGGCDEGVPDDEPIDEVLRSQVWDPHAIDPADCNNPEFEPARPPENNTCEIEITLDSVSFVTGQGATEGRGELTFDATGEVPGSGVSTGGTYPTPSLNPVVTTYMTFNAGQTQGTSMSLGTYTVAEGDTEVVEVCVTATELDNGGINGQDDVAVMCEDVVIGCDAQTGQPTFSQTLGPEDLCGPNTCNGSVSATIQVMRVDADGDDVPNDVDVTPDYCDEVEKGKNGIALIQYFHYGDDGISGLAQSLGTNLSQHYGAYDYVVLVADNHASNANNINATAFATADAVYPPTRDGLMDAFQDVISRGYRFDMLVHSHGSPTGASDAKFATISGGSISGDWLIGATDPNAVGTARGGFPIVAHWSTACFTGYQADAWSVIGAKVGSGAQDVSFYPNTFGNFWDDWVAGTKYGPAVTSSYTPFVISTANAYIEAEGTGHPYWCVLDTVLGENACAEDFFNDDVGANPAKYDLSRVYDHNESGAANMLISSTRIFSGNTGISFGGAGQNWP
jgi:hypothetical protein